MQTVDVSPAEGFPDYSARQLALARPGIPGSTQLPPAEIKEGTAGMVSQSLVLAPPERRVHSVMTLTHSVMTLTDYCLQSYQFEAAIKPSSLGRLGAKCQVPSAKCGLALPRS